MINLDRRQILKWLKTDDSAELEMLWKAADETRHINVGDEIHLRGLIELSNFCCRSCAYCGINQTNANIEFYRMSKEDVVECIRKIHDFGYGTVVFQSGEDFGITAEWMSDIIKYVKNNTNLAVTLSLGERRYDELKMWKESGADRYLLRFETSDLELYRRIHSALPCADPKRDRIAIIQELKKLGYETGSGVMVGIPGQTYETLAQDIWLFAELELDMIGIGPYIPHPDTPLGREYQKMQQLPSSSPSLSPANQVPNTELMTYKTIALTRLLCPKTNIPSTTALATMNKVSGRGLGLMRGANIIMPNVTQTKYRQKYTIYPNKASTHDNAEISDKHIQELIKSIGRKKGTGQGSSRKY